MGRQAEHTHTFPDGRRVGYSLTDRPNGYRVRFVGPDGKRVERATGCTKVGEARAAAPALIAAAFAPPGATSVADWEAAAAHLDTVADLRPDTVAAYRKALDAVRRLFPELTGPAAVTPVVARQFPHRFLTAPYRRSKKAGAATYKRAETTVNSRLKHLRSLWQKYFKPDGLVESNPWADVPPANATRGKRRVRNPSSDAVRGFFDWLAATYPQWELPRLFVTVKMLAGCRTKDLCHARSADLTPTALTLAATTTKTREARTVPLPADVTAALLRVAGPVYVWESAAEGCRQYRPARGGRDPHAGGFDPDSFYHTVNNLFREFNEGRPKADRLRPHDLRARAMTAAGLLYGSADKVARVMGCDVQTARHYIDQQAAYDDGNELARLQAALRPPM